MEDQSSSQPNIPISMTTPLSSIPSFPPLSYSSYFSHPQELWRQALLPAIAEEAEQDDLSQFLSDLYESTSFFDEEEADDFSQLFSELHEEILSSEIYEYEDDEIDALASQRRISSESMGYSAEAESNVTVASAMMPMESNRANSERFTGVSGGAINVALMAAGIAPRKLDSLLSVTPVQTPKKDAPNFERMHGSNLARLHLKNSVLIWLVKLSHWVCMAFLKLFIRCLFNFAQPHTFPLRKHKML